MKRKRRSPSPYKESIRAVVLKAVNDSEKWQYGRDVARAANLTYKQAIDALNALYNSDQIARDGHKFTAKWGPISLKVDPIKRVDFRLLDNVFYNICKKEN